MRRICCLLVGCLLVFFSLEFVLFFLDEIIIEDEDNGLSEFDFGKEENTRAPAVAAPVSAKRGLKRANTEVML